MKIDEMNIIEFGALRQKRVTFSEGLNLICGENESGKSTMMLFIKFMFYGFGRKSTANTDRERGISRSGGRAEGTLTLTFCGEKYKIERRCVMGAKQLSEKKRIIRLSDGEEVFGGREPYEIFIGVSGEVFESSCSVGQLRCSDVNGDKTAGAIENMLLSADENIDISSITSKLEKIRVIFRHKNRTGGSLPKLSEEIASERAKLQSATENHLRLRELMGRSEENTKLREELLRDVSRADALIEQMNMAGSLRKFKLLRAEKEELSKAESDRKRYIECTMGGRIPDIRTVGDIKSAEEKYKDAVNNYESAKTREKEKKALNAYSPELADKGEKVESIGGAEAVLTAPRADDKRSVFLKKRGVALLILGSIFGVAVAAIGVVIESMTALLLGLGVGILGVSVALGAMFVVMASKSAKRRDAAAEDYGCSYDELEEYLGKCTGELFKKREYEKELLLCAELVEVSRKTVDVKRKELEELISCLGGDMSEDILSVAEDLRERIEDACLKLEERDRAILVFKTKVETLENELEGLSEEELEKKVSPEALEADPAALENALRVKKFNGAKLDALEREAAINMNSIATLKATGADPLALSDRITALEEKYREDDEFCRAVTLAIESIEKAGENMRSGVAPMIGKRASEMMNAISGGKYEKLYTTKDLGVSVERGEDGAISVSELLSGGTRDVAYICLRISLMFQLFEEELPPLMLDEALSQLDDARAERVIALLGNLSESGLQCLLFTCHSREEKICEDLGLNVNSIRL